MLQMLMYRQAAWYWPACLGPAGQCSLLFLHVSEIKGQLVNLSLFCSSVQSMAWALVT